MRRWPSRAPAAAFALLFATAAHGEPLAVRATNASKPTLCAETDNIYLKLQSRAVRHFTVEAVHPAYAGMIVNDSMAPDFSHCDMSRDPSFKFEARQVTFYEDAEWRLVGHTYPTNWRPTKVPVRVGDRTEHGLHLVQVFRRAGDGDYEALVVYPSDGYWRARPLPPPNLKEAGYGSSFLVGPIEYAGRPLVAFREIVFDPPARTIRVTYARGGGAILRIGTLDHDRQVLDITLDRPMHGPFAALRSMFVRDTNADVAQVAWRGKDSQRWLQAGVLDFKQANALEIWTGRTTPSRHNTSAPDMIFKNFAPR